jgi:hypothetical protein
MDFTLSPCLSPPRCTPIGGGTSASIYALMLLSCYVTLSSLTLFLKLAIEFGFNPFIWLSLPMIDTSLFLIFETLTGSETFVFLWLVMIRLITFAFSWFVL